LKCTIYLLSVLNDKLEKEAFQLRQNGFKMRVHLKGATLILLKKVRVDVDFVECT
jgi:hypothetical protein